MKIDLILPPGAMRLALAVTVVLSHYLPASRIPFYLPFDAIPVYGFFFLSGFWISRLWYDKYRRCHCPILTFYCSRALRIYPLAILSTLLMAWLIPTNWNNFLSNLILIAASDGPQGHNLINPPAWSLTIELQFYAAAPFLFVIMRNPISAAALLVVGFFFWLVYAYGVTWISLINFIFLFALGILYSDHPLHKLMVRCAPFSLLSMTIIGVASSLPALGDVMVAYNTTRFVAIAFGLVGLPYVAASLSKKSDNFDRVLGDLSYPIYVFHFAGMILATRFHAPATLPTAVVITGALTGCAYILIDRPLERLRSAFVKSRIDIAQTRQEELVSDVANGGQGAAPFVSGEGS